MQPSPRRRPVRRGALPLVRALAALGTLGLLGGCAATSSEPEQARGSARHGGLAVHVHARSSSSATTVRVVVQAEDDHARGAFAYAVHFGDGATAHDLVPQFCLAAPAPRRATWHFTHRYSRSGTYRISARVGANCTAGAAVTVTVRLHVG